MSRVPIPLPRQHVIRRAVTPAATVSGLLASALREHQTGRLDEARRLYLEILSIDARHCDSLHLLGMVEFGAGRPDLAVRMIQRAIALRGDDASYHSSLGLVLQAQGKWRDAVLEYEQALKFKPDCLEALYNLGGAWKALGKLDQAAACYERALRVQPNYVEAYNSLGNVYREQEMPEEARACFERALMLRPDYVESSNNLGILLRAQGKLEEARSCLERALTRKPAYAEAWNSLAHTLQDLNRPGEAAACFRRLLTLRPENAEACNALGALLLAEGNLADAQHWLNKALALNPDSIEASNNLGVVLVEQGELHEAERRFDFALALQPGHPEAQWNLAQIELLMGDYGNGWRDHEARFRRRGNATRNLPQPRWRGEPLNGARILLHAEQGLGDTLQFLRYVPLVQAAGGRVILDIPPRLRRLAEQMPGIEELAMSGDPLPGCDWQCPLMSLPLAFATTVESIPAAGPYLSVPETALWTAGALPWPARGLRVGVAWAGSPSHPNNRFRSLALAALEPLFRVRGAHFFSLQMGPAAAELGSVRGGLTDLSAQIEDMADTAAQMAHLDLVITVDTSVAHLAGALAKPTWVLLPHAPDWRWMLGREDSPWYPTVRLFRQPRMYDWHSVVERVCAELERLTA